MPRRKNDGLNEGCLLILGKLLNIKPKASDPVSLPYGKRDHFLSAAEISFYHVLKGVLGEDIELLCKVRLGDLFYVQRPHENKGARTMDFENLLINSLKPDPSKKLFLSGFLKILFNSS